MKRYTVRRSWMATALIDAAIVYGAGRFLRGAHHEQAFAYRDHFDERDDRAHFIEFLHTLLLYDSAVMDNSSMSSRIGEEVSGLIEYTTALLGERFLTTKELGHLRDYQLDGVAEGLVRLVRAHPQPEQLLQVQVPWGYHGDANHRD